MLISRRDFFMAGSAASALLLTGCGGGGSADGAPKTTKSNACATLTSPYTVLFSNAVSFANSDLPLILPDDMQNLYLGCSNQIVSGSEGLLQEMFVSFIQIVSAAQSCSKGYIRTLRLHLSIPQDTSGNQVAIGDVFYLGDPTNPGSGKVFSGEIILTDPAAADGQNSWAYQIVGGSLQVTNEYNPIGVLPLQMTNVVAKAANAGSGNNQAYASGGQVEMNGVLPVLFEALTTYVDGTT